MKDDIARKPHPSPTPQKIAPAPGGAPHDPSDRTTRLPEQPAAPSKEPDPKAAE
jgi:hypothetical protein